jgi:hypothetical protein
VRRAGNDILSRIGVQFVRNAGNVLLSYFGVQYMRYAGNGVSARGAVYTTSSLDPVYNISDGIHAGDLYRLCAGLFDLRIALRLFLRIALCIVLRIL